MQSTKQTACVHNKFEVLVKDAATGAVRQKAVAYNVILDAWFTNRFYRTSGDLFYAIAFGTGTGTPTAARTSLFEPLWRKDATLVKTVYGYPTSYVQKQIKLEANEYVGKRITEVGIEGYSSGYSGGSYYLITHAMLQDSEGHQIAIDKTDTDVLTITATFYCTHTPAGFGDNAVYPPANKNALVSWVLTGSFPDLYVRFSRYPLTQSSEMESAEKSYKFTGSKTLSLSGGNAATGRMDLPVTTFLDTECNNRIVRHIGIPGVGAVTFPNHDIFPPYPVEQLPIGTGDGVTKEYSIKAPLILPGSDTVYVDGVALVRGTDYEIDYESNCGDWYENYHTAGLSCKSDGVSFGNLRSKTPSNNYYRDPLAWWDCYDRSFYPDSCTVSEAAPIWLDFGEAKGCNRMKLDLITVPADKIGSLKLQYSQDGTAWTDVPGMTRTGQVWTFPLLSARYWRVFIPGYSWTYQLTWGAAARDGQSFSSSFFLGKTVPGLRFTVPPASGKAITASYLLEYPFKTAGNLLRFACSFVLQRG